MSFYKEGKRKIEVDPTLKNLLDHNLKSPTKNLARQKNHD